MDPGGPPGDHRNPEISNNITQLAANSLFVVNNSTGLQDKKRK